MYPFINMQLSVTKNDNLDPGIVIYNNFLFINSI